MNQAARVCAKCLMKDTVPGISFDQEGICSACTDPAEGRRKQAVQEATGRMLALFEAAKGHGGAYDVLVLVSGGVDSAYVLDTLTTGYGLRALGLFLNEDIGPPAAAKNARRIARATGTDLMAMSMDVEFVKRWVREGLPAALQRDIGPHAGRDVFVHLRRAVSFNLAIQLRIPMVAEGIVPYQGPRFLVADGPHKRHYLQDLPRRTILREVFREVFGDQYAGSLYDLDVRDRADEELPVAIFPNAILGYSKRLAFGRMLELGLPLDDLRSYATNTDINPYVSLFSYAAYDCHVNIEPMATQLRRRGALFVGSRQLGRGEALELLAEMKRISLWFAEHDEELPDELGTYLKLFPKFRELLGTDEVFLARVRRKRRVRFFADYFGLPRPAQ